MCVCVCVCVGLAGASQEWSESSAVHLSNQLRWEGIIEDIIHAKPATQEVRPIIIEICHAARFFSLPSHPLTL